MTNFVKQTLVCALFVAPVVAAPNFSNTVQPFMAKNCILCHNANAKVGGLDLSGYRS